MKKQRKHYTPEEKVAILRRHLLENESISKLCDELGLQPTVFYRWQKEFFENGAARLRAEGATERLSRPGADRLSGEEDPDKGTRVLAELMAEHVALKKTLGGL